MKIALLLLLLIPSACFASPESDLVSLINKERVKTNLKPLILNEQLRRGAFLKARDMDKYDYFAHVSLTGHRAQDFVEKYGYKFTWLGNNLSKGYQLNGVVVPKDVFNGWLGSVAHKKNILDKDFVDVGVGMYGVYTVAFFGKPVK